MIQTAERIVVALVLSLIAYLYVEHLQDRAAAAEHVAQQLRDGIADRDRTITALSDLAHQKDVTTAKMEGERSAIRAQLATRETQMRKLEDENADVRAWAAAAVPGAVAGLREHPTFTGAAAYREFLSKGAALPAARHAGEQ